MTAIPSPLEALDTLNELARLPSRARFGWTLHVHPDRSRDSLRYRVSATVPRRRADATLGRRRAVLYTDQALTPHEAIVDAALLVTRWIGCPWDQARAEVAR